MSMPLQGTFGAMPGSATRPTTRSAAERKAVWFAAAILAISLGLQRFGLPFGGKALSIVGPLGFALVAIGLATGALAFHRGRLITYLAMMAAVLLGTAWQSVAPIGLESAVSTNSLVQFLLLTSFATLTFAAPVEEGAFFRVVTLALLLVAVAGIAQFIAQFAGLRLFAFTGLIPDRLLFENGWNLQIPVGIGTILKSNGFVLVEPSVFSQMMALGLIIEAMSRRRLTYLAAFLAGLMLSFSGTGWIVLAAFVAGSAIGMGWRGLLIAVGMVVLLAVTVTILALVAPDFVTTLTGRLSEIQQPGTSGHQRFITPFWMLSDVMTAHPLAWLFGIGSGGSERLVLPYDYDVNTPIKVMVDYGVPTLVLYLLLFVLGRKTRAQAALVLPAIVLFMFTGGYQQFPPLVFIALLLTSVAWLRVDAPAA